MCIPFLDYSRKGKLVIEIDLLSFLYVNENIFTLNTFYMRPKNKHFRQSTQPVVSFALI